MARLSSMFSWLGSWSTLGALVFGAAATVGLGCDSEAYCFNCEGPDATTNGGSAGGGGRANGGSAGSVGVGGTGVSVGGSGGSANDCSTANLQTDPQHCGACGVVCSFPGALPKCEAGKCVLECAQGFYDLDKDQKNGCELSCTPSNGGVEVCDGVDNDCNGKVDDDPKDIATNVLHCGACNNACVLANALPECNAGKCAVANCLPGFTDGDKDPKNGCEYGCGISNGGKEICDGKDNDCNGKVDDQPDVAADPKNCGQCGNDCAGKFPNTVPTCEGGQCKPGACVDGSFDKDGDPSNGCEYSCLDTCSPPFSTPSCDATGACSIKECQPGHLDLDKDVANGCEYTCDVSNAGKEICDLVDNDCNGVVDDPSAVPVEDDPKNCGACGKSCAGAFPNGQPACSAGACVLVDCLGGYLDKDGDPTNGCEYNCETLCSFPFAVPACNAAGDCQMGACLPGYYDLDKNSANGCEYACATSNGGVEICDKRDNDCNGIVDDPGTVDVSSDPLNCGGCGVNCIGKFPNAALSCVGGACVLGACLDGYSDVDGNAANGCEYNCQATCSFPFATGVCAAGNSCTFGQCVLGHYDLDKQPDNGCEYACDVTNAGVEICDARDNDCNGQVDEGFDFNADPFNCGACGRRCDVLFPNSTVACQVQGATPTCVFTGCKAGFNNDDGNAANGCEYACTPTGPEICDGKDNDCDGIADNPPGGVFNPPLANICGAGTSQGVCQSQTVCQNGVPVCVQTQGPSTETCDGKDNDCDGNIDNGPMPQIGVPCGTSQVGECKFGTSTCTSGAITCQGAVAPKAETCNGKDDDCNGVIDDNPSGAGVACGSAVGACKQGTQQCIAGALSCQGGIAASAEVCDGPGGAAPASFDNNCNGTVDEGCPFPAAGITRLDTNGSTQGQHASFQLQGASANSDFLVVYGDKRGSGDIYGRVSTDAGTSWGANDFPIANEGFRTVPDGNGTRQEAIVEVEPFPFMRAGRAYMAYSRFTGGIRRIYVRSANTPYTAWSTGVKVDSNVDTDGSIDCYDPQGVVAKAGATAATDQIAVVWSEIAGTQASPTRNIFLKYSKDGGATYSAAVPVNTGTGANKGELPVLATDGAGVVYVTWRDKRNAGLAQTFVGRIDVSAGAPAFANVTALQPNVANASAEQIVIAADGGANVTVAWTDLRPPSKAIRFATSNDRGLTWTNTTGTNGVLNLDSTFANASAPSLAARGGKFVAAWEDTRSGTSDIRLNASTDGGKTWQATSTRADTGDGLGATASIAPRIVIGLGDTVHVTWQDLRFPASAVLANTSIDLGRNVHPDAGTVFRMDINTGAPAAGAGADSQLPFVLASPLVNRAAVIWVDQRDASGNNGQNGDIWTRTLQ
jgi:hypothetical protein